jgi:hypothetical protein
VPISRCGGPEVLDIAEPEAGDGQKRYDVSTAAVTCSDTRHRVF